MRFARRMSPFAYITWSYMFAFFDSLMDPKRAPEASYWVKAVSAHSCYHRVDHARFSRPQFTSGRRKKNVAFIRMILCAQSWGPRPSAEERLSLVLLSRLTLPPRFYNPRARATFLNEETEAHRQERVRNPDPRAAGTRTIGHAGVGLLQNAGSRYRPCHADISFWPLQPEPRAPGVATPACVSRQRPALCPVALRWCCFFRRLTKEH